MIRNETTWLDAFALHDIQTMLIVAEVGGFRRASHVLGVGQSTVSRRIRKLEDEFGVSVFERRANGARLTNAGRQFATHARKLLDELGTVVEAAKGAGIAANGQLRIGLVGPIASGALRELLRVFIEEHDMVDLQFTNAGRGELFMRLSHRQLDVVISVGEPGRGIYDTLVLDREGIFVAVASDAAFAHRECLVWSDITDETFLVSEGEFGQDVHDLIVWNFSGLHTGVRVRRHCFSREGVMGLVGLGLGICLVTGSDFGLIFPNVTFVPIGNKNDRVPYYLSWCAQNDNPALRRFVSLARVRAKLTTGTDVAPSRIPDRLP